MEDLEIKAHTSPELESLIRLLADDHETMQSAVNARLIELGEGIVPSLWDARTEVTDVVRSRIDGILVRLSSEAGETLALTEWRELFQFEGDVDLERGVCALAKLHTPDLNWAETSEALDSMADEIAIRLSGITEPNDIVEAFIQYVFKDQAYRGGEDATYFDPDGHYMDRVIARKSGVPIALSAVCLLLATRINLPLFGVGLPDHFVVKYQRDDAEILFAPFHDGAIITREECEQFIIRQKLTFTDEILTPVTNRYILERMLANLRQLYLHKDDREKTDMVAQYARTVRGDLP